jgi:hypothetical protein
VARIKSLSASAAASMQYRRAGVTNNCRVAGVHDCDSRDASWWLLR